MTFERSTPSRVRAVFDALSFSSPSDELLSRLSDAEWRKLLAFSDRTHLTLPLSQSLPQSAPNWVRERLHLNLTNNAVRWDRLKDAFFEIDSAFRGRQLNSVVLKGFAHCPDFVRDPRLRVQNDIDLFLRSDDLPIAFDLVSQLGYVPIDGGKQRRVDHLPAMIRKTGWEWRGDHFDPEIPVSLDLHFRLWDPATERFGPLGLENFWGRLVYRQLEEISFAAFAAQDALGYASLHALRHLLRGDLRPSHIYEIASFLEWRRQDDGFWRTWQTSHDETLRQLESICFAIASDWFGCQLHPLALAQQATLSDSIQRWLAVYSRAPIAGLFQPNKVELWLHLSLLDSTQAKLSVLTRRLIPVGLPGPVGAVHIPESERTWRVRLRSRVDYAVYAGKRAVHHARAFPPTIFSGLVWSLKVNGGLGKPFWLFFFAAAFFDLGLFIYFLLYNVYLLQLGFREDFLGFLSSAMTAGGIAGSLPAAAVLRKCGVKRSLLACFIGVAGVSALRANITSRPALIALAFIGGAASCLWAVAISPTIAQLTSERNRARGFSLVFSTGIAIGIAGGIVGGLLPGWLSAVRPSAGTVQNYRVSLLIGCMIVLLGLWPISRLNLSPVASERRRLFRPSPFLIRFLVATAIWNLGTGAFNPFVNVYFTRMHMSVGNLGLLFSTSQLVQACVVLSAPFVLRKFGIVRGVSGMQFATAAALLLLLAVRTPAWASTAYVVYMAAQFMSEPGMYTMLMDCVTSGERSGASGLNFFVAFSAQAIAASVAGIVMTRFGYAPLLFVSAVICLLAAAVFRTLPSQSSA